MLASKTNFIFKFAQRGLITRFQHSGALGSEPASANPPPSLKKAISSELSYDEIEERIEQGKECAKMFYSRDSYLGRPLDKLDKEKEAEVDRVIAGMSDKAEQIAGKAHEIEELAEEAVETAQQATKTIKSGTKGKK
uniref:Uncharacterized protein n=1 Tax=Acrobeloides nanus TaxID=290746 RepID=A0A914DCL3_9BILA